MFFKHVVKNPSTVLPILSVIMKVALSMVIIVSASIVLMVINRSQRATQTQHFFFIANVMFANIMAVTMRSVAFNVTPLKIMDPNIHDTIRCKAFSTIPVVTSFLMVVALCSDRMFTVMAPGMYKKTMTKISACTIVAIIWIMSSIATGVGVSNCSLVGPKDETCSTGCFEQFETKAVALLMVLSGVMAAIHNTFIFYKVFITTLLDEKFSAWYRFARLWKAWRIYKETQPISITLLNLGVYNTVAGIVLIMIDFIQTHSGGLLQDALISFCSYHIVDISMLIQALLYIKFLHTIKEWIWFK